MRYFLVGLICITIHLSCSKSEPIGFLGEWEGTTERVNGDGKLVESETECTIKSLSGTKRSVALSVAGTSFQFEATEDMEMLVYKDYPLGEDSTVMSYISGSAELLNDTILHFEHDVYALRGSALLYSDKVVLSMTRK